MFQIGYFTVTSSPDPKFMLRNNFQLVILYVPVLSKLQAACEMELDLGDLYSSVSRSVKFVCSIPRILSSQAFSSHGLTS